MNSVLDCMVSDRIGPGKLGVELSKNLASMTENRDGIALVSYYNSIYLAFLALGLERGDSIVLSALADRVYLSVARDLGFNVFVADVEPETGGISIRDIERFSSHNPKAIVVYYPFGVVESLENLRDFGIPVIEDISHGVGGSVRNMAVGSLGDLSIISLSPYNKITSSAGAVVLSKNVSVLRRLKKIAMEDPKFEKLPNMNAAIALAQVKDFSEHIEIRKKIASIYMEALVKSKHKTLFVDDEVCTVDYSAFPVVVENGLLNVKKYAKKNNLETLEAFSYSIISEYGELERDLPGATLLLMRTLVFPLYSMLSSGDVDLIARVISTLP